MLPLPPDPHAMALRTLGEVVRRSAPLVSVSPDATIISLAETLRDARVDAVAVLDGGSLRGLVTSRDVASCVARADDLEKIHVSDIMTASPVSLADTESPARALAIMRSGRFRHVPVVNASGTLLGIVDVLHLAYDAITRLQISYEMIPTRKTFDFLRIARASIEKPTLRPIVETASLVTLTRSHSVSDACEAIVSHHLAAVVIVDDHGILDGIFTCRDVTTRVVAKRLDAHTTLIEDVMTVSPDCASPDYTILESLQRMQACGFRHLPVVEDHSRKVIGLVNVLQLASDALLDIDTPNSRQSSNTAASIARHGSSQPTSFASFFTGLFSASSNARNSQSSPSRPPPAPHVHQTHRASGGTAATGRQFSTLSRRETYLPTPTAAADTPCATFKFRDANGDFRRVRVPLAMERGAFDKLVVNVRRRYTGASATPVPIKLKYTDDEGDEVLMANDEDLASCLQEVSNSKKTVKLRVIEVERNSAGYGPSPASSRSNSVPGSPRSSILSASGSQISIGRAEPQTDPASGGSSVSLQSGVPEISPSARKTHEAHKKMMDNEISAAIELFDEALALDNSNARAMGGRGAARLIGGNSTGAEEDYREAIALLERGNGGKVGDSTFEMCIIGLVEALIDQRRYEEGVLIAARIDADCSSGNARSSDAFRDELESASEAARTALENGDFGDAMSLYSNALRVEAAYLKLAPSEIPRASLRIGRAKCYKTLEDYDMALEDYEAAVKLEPESVAAHKGCASCLASLEQLNRALEAYQVAHKLDPADDEVNREIYLLKKLLPDPLKDKKAEIAKLGAMLGSLNLPKGKKT